MKFTLKDLTEQDVNLILNGLAQLPYIQVQKIISTIQQQAMEQVQQANTSD